MCCTERPQRKLFQAWESYDADIKYNKPDKCDGSRKKAWNGSSSESIWVEIWVSLSVPPVEYLGQVSRIEISAMIQNLATIDCCSLQTPPACIIRNQTIKLFESIVFAEFQIFPNIILGEPQEMHLTGPQSASENLGKLHCLRWKLQSIQEFLIYFSPFKLFGLFYLNAEELEKCF